MIRALGVFSIRGKGLGYDSLPSHAYRHLPATESETRKPFPLAGNCLK